MFLQVIWHEETFKVYCIEAINLRPQAGGRVRLDGGGIGEDYVRIDMVSRPGSALEFNITVYAFRDIKYASTIPVQQ